MRMRKGAPLLFALVALLGAVQAASAQYSGAARFSIFRNTCCDAQNCYSTCQEQNRVTYKLVYDTVMEKRWHTCYQTVCETVNKQVMRTCYKNECKTMFRDCHVTKYRTEIQECYRPVSKQCWKDIECIVCKPCVEHCVKDVECCVRRCVNRICEKNCHYTVCKPVYEQHCHVHCCQVTKQICEQHCHDVCYKACHRVTENCHKEVCCQINKCFEECCSKQVCVPCYKTVAETCYKTCVNRICEPVTTCKTVTRRVVECVDEPVDPCGSGVRGFGLFRGLFGNIGGNACCDPCPPAKATCDNCDPCFDPCACKTFHLFGRLKGIGSGSTACIDNCSDNCGRSACAPCPTTRKRWHVRCITEEVPCTKMVTRCVTVKVPYTVCKKVCFNEMKTVSYTVRRNLRGAYVDDKGCGYECDGPGRVFKEGAVARKQVPYSVTKMVHTIERKSIPYTTTRCARGAYVDPNGGTHGCDGPGRSFKEGATYNYTTTSTTRRMVQEQCVKKVQYCVKEWVTERQIKKVPYQVCHMVPHTITKKVPYTVCVQEKYTVCRKVPYTECIKQEYTVNCKVPYTVCETVPCTIKKQVKVCVPTEVCVKKARLVPVTVSCDPGCPTTGCCDNCCGSKSCFLGGLRQRWFASLCSTGCCEQTCNTPAPATCTDSCTDYCREGLLQRLFRNRFACEPTCDTGCSATSAPVTPPTAPSEAIVPPKALPKN